MKYAFRIEAELEVTADRLNHARKDVENLSAEVGALTNGVLPLVHRAFPHGSILLCEVRHEVTSEAPDRFIGGAP